MCSWTLVGVIGRVDTPINLKWLRRPTGHPVQQPYSQEITVQKRFAQAFLTVPLIGLIVGCKTTEVVVADYEEFHSQAIAAAAEASRINGDSTTDLTLTLQVTTGFTAGATAPIPVVPLTIGGSISRAATIQSKVDLSKVPVGAVDAKSMTVSKYIFDESTGTLTPINP